jgi:phycobilisome core-membrane linker protein
MAAALRPGQPQGFGRRRSIGQPLLLPPDASASDVRATVDAAYKQLLNRVPLAAERLTDAESQLRDGQLSLADFVAQVALNDLFQQRLNRMAPLRAAAAAHLALLGRAAQPAETSRFLATRVRSGLRQAIEGLLGSDEYSQAFGQNTVPYIRGMATRDGIPLSTVNRTANLYQGNAGLTPKPREAL